MGLLMKLKSLGASMFQLKVVICRERSTINQDVEM
jgi:hypothetical protein